MAWVCSLSGEVPEKPVLSLLSKHIFEERLLEKYVQAHGKDPITNDSMTMEDIIILKSSNIVPPKPANCTNIPSLLKSLQDEWDSLVLQSYSRAQQLQNTRQELSLSLYQLDASCRVIARLLKENEELKQLLSEIPNAQLIKPEQEPSIVPEENINQTQEERITSEVLEKIQALAHKLTSERKIKNKKSAETGLKIEDVSNFKCQYTNTNLHSVSVPGINCLDIKQQTSKIVTGGNDKNAVVFDRDTEKVLTVLKGHTKKITNVVYHPYEDVIVTGSADATVRIWKDSEPQTKSIIKAHLSTINGVVLHPTGDYIATTSLDNSWTFIDMKSEKIILRKHVEDENSNLSCCQIHPDGLIFATANDTGSIKIWDFKECANVVNFGGHTSAITSISFSENGYFLASASKDLTVRLWDLRKTKCFKVLTFDENTEVNCLTFDQTGQYLAIGGKQMQVYSSKKWELLSTLNDHSEMITSVKFDYDGKYLASTSLDRSLRLFHS